MLTKIFTMRCDSLWGSMLAMLAKQAKRSKAEFIRDMVYYLSLSQAGEEFINLMTESEVHYDK